MIQNTMNLLTQFTYILWEKLWRLETILSHESLYLSDKQTQLAHYYLSLLNQLKENIFTNTVLTQHLKETEDLDTTTFTRELKRLQSFTPQFKNLYEEIGSFLNLTPPEELNILCESSAYALNLGPSYKDLFILFSHSWDKDLYQSVPHIVQNETIDNKIYIVKLPYLQMNNPLQWQVVPIGLSKILYHQENLEFKLVNPIKQKYKLFNDDLCEQIIQDFITLNILGQAYFYSFVEEWLWTILNSNNKECHQSFYIRSCLMNTYLHSNHVINDEVQNHFSLLNQLKDTMALQNPMKNDDFQWLLSHLEEKITISNRYTNLSVAQKISKKLQEGILIASRLYQNTENLYSNIQAFCTNKTHSGEAIYEQLNQLKEIPNCPIDIINAGWIEKNSLYNESVKNHPHLPFLQNAEIYAKKIGKLDNLLIKSIEIASVHKIISCT